VAEAMADRVVRGLQQGARNLYTDTLRDHIFRESLRDSQRPSDTKRGWSPGQGIQRLAPVSSHC
jgi:hypothetical protein